MLGKTITNKLGTVALAAGVLFATGGVNHVTAAEPNGESVEFPSVRQTAPLSLSEYFSKVGTLLFDFPTEGRYATVREALQAQATAYRRQFKNAAALAAPREVRVPHRALVEALLAQAQAAEKGAKLSSANTVFNEVNINAAAHRITDTGYARDDESAAACDLKRVADYLGYRLQVLGFCALSDAPKPAVSTLGSAQAPVNNIRLVQEVTYDPTSGEPRPNVDGFQYSTIFAKAGTVKITFENFNPQPFVFNIALYDNSSSSKRVQYEQLIVQSEAFSGYKIHEITATLKPGVYTYVDSVHPIALRGRLIVVP